MKKYLYLASAVALMSLASCQQDDFAPAAVADGEGNFNLTIEAPEAMGVTRSYTLGADDALYGPQSNSAMGGVTNVDWTAYDLRYKVVVYQKNTLADGSYEYVPVLNRVQTVDTYQGITMSFRLTTNRTYKVVTWADFVAQGTSDDLHYDTFDLTHVTCLDDTDHMLNDESRDAYYARGEYTIGGNDANVSLVLRRPFAKLRIITTDWALDDLEMPDEFTLTYKNCTIYKSFNALTAAATDPVDLGDAGSGTEITCKGTINKDVKEYALNYDQTDRNRTLVVDYIFGGFGAMPTPQIPIHFDFTPTGLATRSVDVDIPTMQNYLTTVMGNLLTGNMNLTLTVDEMFRNEYNNYYLSANNAFPAIQPATDDEGAYLISSPGELVWMQEYLNGLSSHPAMTIKLTKDIDLDGYYWTPMNYSGTTDRRLTFDGQGHTIYNINIDATDISDSTHAGFFSNINHGIVKNLNIENFTINNACHIVGGVVGVLYGTLENVSISNVFMRQKNHDISIAMKYDYGGLVGIWYHDSEETAVFKDCHAVNVNIQAVGRSGGLIGFQHNEGTDNPRIIENCSVREVFINDELYPGFVASYGEYWFKQNGSLIGAINTDEITFRNCSQSDVTYVYGYCDQNYMLYLHTGDEGGDYTIIELFTGAEVPVGPQHKFYGFSSVENVIVNEE
ncbi:MAG: DUF6562 domain-containing protein [Lepagella sp.]